MYLNRKNRQESSAELEETKAQLAALQVQMAELMTEKRRGRPPKE